MFSLKRKADILKKRESFMLEANPRISMKTRQISGNYQKYIVH